MAYLDIELKEDTAEKLAAVAGRPTKNYLFQDEINAIVSRINQLRDMIMLSLGQVNSLIATGIEIALGDIGALSLIEFINASDGYNLGTAGTTFLSFKKDGISYVYVFVGLPANYGSTTNTLTVADVKLLYNSSQSLAAGFSHGVYKAWFSRPDIQQPPIIQVIENTLGFDVLFEEYFSSFFKTNIPITAKSFGYTLIGEIEINLQTNTYTRFSYAADLGFVAFNHQLVQLGGGGPAGIIIDPKLIVIEIYP